MPELPEVETVRRGLSPVMEGATFTRVQLNRPQPVDRRTPVYASWDVGTFHD